MASGEFQTFDTRHFVNFAQSNNADTTFRHSGIPYRHKGSDNFGKSAMPPTSQAEHSNTSYVMHESRYMYKFILIQK